jgi:hypothetical protein
MHRSLRYILLIGLFLLALPLIAFAQPETSEPIAIGDTVEGQLTEDLPTIAYAFEAVQDQVITINLVSEDFDCYLTLQNADGEVLATDDDGGGDLDSEITSFSIPADGEYYILAQSYASSQGGVEPGAFTLSIEEASTSLLEYGMSIEGELTEREPFVYYNFRGNQGDTVLITMIGDTGLDSYLSLYRGTDTSTLLISNDDGAGNLHSLIGPYSLPADGIYTLEATSFSRAAPGTFTLTIERAEVILLEYGDSVEGGIEEQRPFLYYQFEATAGDIVDVLAEGGAEVGTSLVLTGPSGFQLGYSDSYSGADPVLNDLLLSEDGTYTILVRGLDETSAGKVTVTLEQVELESLDEESKKVSFSSTVTRNTVLFSGEAGEQVTLTFVVTEGDNASPNVTVTQNNSTVTYISSSDVTMLEVSFVVPDDGDVLVQIDEFSYVDSVIEVTLTR